GAFPALRALRRHARAAAPRRAGHGGRGPSAVPRGRRAAAGGALGARGRSQLRLALTSRLLFFACLFFVTATYGQFQSDWERANEERLKQSGEQLIPPPPLERSRLVEVKLHVSADT